MRFWPVPALLIWALAWGLLAALHGLGVATWAAVPLAALVGAVGSFWGNTPWRRILLAVGFPVSMLLTSLMRTPPSLGQFSLVHVFCSGLPAWAWLLPLGLLLVLYPVRNWRDAPMFPTPRGALHGLHLRLRLPGSALKIVDAGCGLGDGLRELHSEFPNAQLTGFEWSWPLRWVCAWRARYASIHRVDMWAADWSTFDFVYLFQRPESLPRAIEKAARELRRGAWLGSLEFEAVGITPQQVHECADGRRLWLYQVPFKQSN